MLKTLTLIVSVVIALGLVVLLGVMARPDGAGSVWEHWQQQPRRGALTEEQRQWADVARRYVQNNTQPGSGLVNGKDRYPIVSLWNIGDSLIALSAARRLDLIPAGVRCPFVGAADDARSFTGDPHRRARCVVRCGQRRFQSERWHRRRSGDGSPAGWHAFHGAKLPEYRTFLERIALRWNFCNLLTQDGQPLDGREQNGAWRSAAASDVGYADYNGAAFRLWGFQRTSTRTAPFKTAVVYGEPSPLRHAIRASPARPPASKAPLSADRPRDGMAGTPSRRGGRRQHGTTGPTPLPGAGNALASGENPHRPGAIFAQHGAVGGV